MAMLELSDEELLARFRAGQTESLDQLFARYHTRVAVWCYRFTGDRESAGDLAQDIFLRAYRNLDSFRGDSKFSTWLYTVARNHCVNERKARAARAEESLEMLELDIPDSGQPDVLTALERKQTVETMRGLLDDTLDSTEKQVMTLHFGQEVSLDAVTRLLGLTNASGARAYVVSAKRKLATAVQRWKARQGRSHE